MLPFLCFTAQFLMGRNPGNEKKINVAHFPAGTEVIGVYFPNCLSFIVEISFSIQYMLEPEKRFTWISASFSVANQMDTFARLRRKKYR